MGLFDGPPGSKFEFYFVGQLRAQHQIDVEIKSAVHHGLFHSLHSDTCLLLSAHERKKINPITLTQYDKVLFLGSHQETRGTQDSENERKSSVSDHSRCRSIQRVSSIMHRVKGAEAI